MPLAFGLPYAEVGTRPEIKRIDTLKFPTGALIGDRANYAYLFEWHGYYAPRALYRLQKLGIRAKVSLQPFEIATAQGRRRFDYGTVMIALGQQSLPADSIHLLMQQIVREHGIDVFAVNTGLSTVGLGSSNFETVPQLRAAMLAGVGITPMDAGEVWHLLDSRFDIDIPIFGALSTWSHEPLQIHGP
jgi:hypothetical protein